MLNTNDDIKEVFNLIDLLQDEDEHILGKAQKSELEELILFALNNTLKRSTREFPRSIKEAVVRIDVKSWHKRFS